MVGRVGCLWPIYVQLGFSKHMSGNISLLPASLHFQPHFPQDCPTVYSLSQKKNLFNLLVYLGAVSLCPVVLSLLSHWLCASPPCVPVSHKSNPLQTPRHSVVYTSGWGTVSPGQGGNCEFSHGCWETNNRPSAAWQSPGLAASSWKKLRARKKKKTHTHSQCMRFQTLTDTHAPIFNPPLLVEVRVAGFCCSLSQLSEGEGRVTPWTGC